MSISYQTLPKSEYFTLNKLADGVYAAISIPGTGSWSNAGIIDIGDRTVIFDTFATTKAATDLRNVAEKLTGRKTSIVINSHDHFDHVHGNQVFHDSIIISTKLTCEQIKVRFPRFIEIVKKHPEYLDELKKKIENESNLIKRRELVTLLGEYTAIDEEASHSILTVPTIHFNNSLVINGSERNVELITYGGGHSQSDSFLYLPKDKILFLADLLHINNHADFRHGDIDTWIQILDQVKLLDFEVVISGHGAIGTIEDINKMQNYFYDLKQIAEDWTKNGGTVENVHSMQIPEIYADYEIPSIFYSNLITLINKKSI